MLKTSPCLGINKLDIIQHCYLTLFTVNYVIIHVLNNDISMLPCFLSGKCWLIWNFSILVQFSYFMFIYCFHIVSFLNIQYCLVHSAYCLGQSFSFFSDWGQPGGLNCWRSIESGRNETEEKALQGFGGGVRASWHWWVKDIDH